MISAFLHFNQNLSMLSYARTYSNQLSTDVRRFPSLSREDNVQHTFHYSLISILTDSKVAHMYKIRLMFSYVMHKGRILKLRKRNSLRNKTPFWRERVDQLASQLGES